MVIKKQQKLNELLQPIIEGMGFEFIGCEHITQGRFSTLRVYVDKENGVTLDECGQISSQIGAALDVEDQISSKYTLEVSSPGFDRPLFTLDHFKKFKGQNVSVHLNSPLNERRNFKGMIINVDDKNVLIEVDGEEFSLPFDMIGKANIIN